MDTTNEVGSYLRSLATHHNHGAGWRWTRYTADLEYIRFSRDHTGYNHWTKRLRRALDWKMLTGRDGLSRSFRLNSKDKPLSTRFLQGVAQARAWFLVSIRKDQNRPDGQINGNLVFWEEDGEYIECVGPTVGEKIADFLENEPDNPYAKAIAEEIQRIWTLPREKAKPKGSESRPPRRKKK